MPYLPKHIATLSSKFLDKKATEKEKKILEDWYLSYADEQELVIRSKETTESVEARLRERISATLSENKIQNRNTPVRSMNRLTMVAAAMGGLLILATSYFIYNKNASENKPLIAQNISDAPIKPGKNTAILTLADGSKIALDSSGNGAIGQQGAVQIKKLSNGEIVYSINDKTIDENDEAFYNTITTPRGGKYNIKLSDGTIVWLNAASSVRFPVIFAGKKREITSTGEIYLEVAHIPSKPFIVHTGNNDITVLGTHFNVNGYTDEGEIRTTLIEGKVAVSQNGGAQKYLRPGQQSINGEKSLSINFSPDLEEVMAWKEGKFFFRSTSLKQITRQISRWYDVDIVYDEKLSTSLTGQLTRNDDIKKLLHLLELTDAVRFTIKNRTVHVRKHRPGKRENNK